MRRSALAALCLLVAIGCGGPAPSEETRFRAWLAENSARGAAFSRFEALLAESGVASVVPNHQLWRVDQLRAACADTAFQQPPERLWRNIVPTLRYIRDHVRPALGSLQVVSGYRSQAFNACIEGASRSAHLDFAALDLESVDRAVTRDVLIARLCPLHARGGAAGRIGLGIYAGRRFHLDARGHRGWGSDHRRASFPCVEDGE
ncbi:MAG: hypothetical protein GC206_08725 [Alphaproteobacteria bacterium]|nr:hypothetical protein [Alphaproteobacteria bacterium]